MSNFMEFLEQMGQDAQLRYATSDELEQALTRAQIEPAVQAAVLAGDRRGWRRCWGRHPIRSALSWYRTKTKRQGKGQQ